MANTIDLVVKTNGVTVLNQTADAAENTAKGFSAKAELRALNQQLLSMDQSSEEFAKASKRAAELKDNISDLSAEISANAGNAFEGLSNNVSLFGSRLMDLDLKGAGQALTGMGSAVTKINFKTIQDEVGGLTTGLFNLGKAVISNPFFLAAGALTALVVYWDDITNAINGTTQKVNELNKANENLQNQNKVLSHRIELEKIINGNSEKAYRLTVEKLSKDIEIAQNEVEVKKLSGDINGIREAENTLLELRNQLNGVNVQHEVDRAKIVENAYKIAYENWGKEHDAQEAANVYDQERVLKAEERRKLEAQVQAIKQQQNREASIGIGLIGNEVVDNQIKAKQNAEILILQQKIKKSKQDENALAAASKKIIEESLKVKEDETKQEDKTAKSNKERLDYEREARRNSLDEQERIAEEIYQSTLSQQQKEIDAVRNKYFELIELAYFYGQDATDLKEAQAREEQAINQKYLDAIAEQNKVAAEKERERQKQQAEWEIQSQEQLAYAKWNIAEASISLLSTLFAKNKKAADVAFALEKGLAIARVVISNRAANSEILAKQLAFYSSSGPLALPLAAASAAPMFAANNLNAAASIAAIVASGVSKFMGGGGASLSTPSVGGGGTGGLTPPSPANFAFLGNQPNQQQPPLQAYVVSGQVSSNLEAQQLIQNQSRLGG